MWVDEPGTKLTPPGSGFWAVLRHAEIISVLRAPTEFSSSLGLTQIFDAPTPLLPYARKMMINMDPPDHGRIRRLLSRAFTPRATTELVERIRPRAEALVDAVLEQGSGDFVTDVSADLPLLTLADVFGVPEVDRWLMYDWSNRVIGYLDEDHSQSAAFDATDATDMARQALAVRPKPDASGRMPDPRLPAGMADLYEYARLLGAHKREHPGDDITSALMTDGADGNQVTVEEFENLFWLFSIAGNETTRNALPGGMLTLVEHPAQLRRLRDDRALLPSAVEEILRWWSPVLHFRRTAAVDSVLGGQSVAAGDKVVVFFPSANRDEGIFPDADCFDVGRTPNPHLALGFGPHFCIGAHLAREQMRAMLSVWLDRVADTQLAGEPVRLRSSFQNGLKHLPLRWSPA